MKSIFLSENTVKHQCKSLMRKLNVFHYHNYQTLGSYKGLSDTTALLNNGITLHIEFKKPGGKQSEYQKEFQRNVERNNQVYLLIDNVEEFAKILNHYLKQDGLFIEFY